MKQAVIVAGARTAVGRAPKGTLRATRPDDMAAAAIGEAVKRAGGLDPAEVEDVLLGCAVPEGSQGLNVARVAALRADHGRLRQHHRGWRDRVDVAGADAHADVLPNPDAVRTHPEYYMGMGLT